MKNYDCPLPIEYIATLLVVVGSSEASRLGRICVLSLKAKRFLEEDNSNMRWISSRQFMAGVVQFDK